MRRPYVLVVGANGLIGNHIADRLGASGQTVIRAVRHPNGSFDNELKFDLSSRDFSKLPLNIGSCFLLGAQTSMAVCMMQPESTRRLNVDDTVALAKYLHIRGTHLIYVSTNLVLPDNAPFTPADTPLEPQNIYAQQKGDVENALLDMGGAAVLRITKLANSLLPLMREWYHRLQRGQEIAPFYDLKCSPIALESVVDALQIIQHERLCGIFQISGDQDISYDQIAVILANKMGADISLVRPVRSSDVRVELPSAPRNTTLDITRSAALLGFELSVATQVVSDLAEFIVSQDGS